jgi:hypothetical protein
MESRDERLARMRALMSKEEVFFDNKTPGEQTLGTVLELGEGEGNYGSFPIVLIEEDDRLVRVNCYGKCGEYVRGRDVRIGDTLGIQYEGKKPMRDGKTFNSYRCYHLPAEPAPDTPRIPNIEDTNDEPFDEYGEPF